MYQIPTKMTWTTWTVGNFKPFGIVFAAANRRKDMLDDFSAVKLDSKTAPQSSAPSGSVPSATETSKAPDAAEKTLDDMLGDEEFTKQLQEGMADLLGELDKNV